MVFHLSMELYLPVCCQPYGCIPWHSTAHRSRVFSFLVLNSSRVSMERKSEDILMSGKEFWGRNRFNGKVGKRGV